MGVDYYNLLKVSKNANEDDLRRAYKRLAMKWHPDKNPFNKKESEAKFKQISEAYDVLSDTQKRKIYDLYGDDALKSSDFVAPANPKSSFSYMPRDADDIFAEFFSGTGDAKSREGYKGESYFKRAESAKQTNKKAPPIESKLMCSLEDIYMGSRRKMKISRTVPDDFGRPKNVDEVLKIDIKPGWKKGTKITFPEKGNQEPGVSPADLIFIIDEKPHLVFQRDGNDLVMNQKLSLLEALTGKTLNITTLDGRNLTAVTDIVKPGYEMVIKNEGMPISKEPNKKGNLRIKFEIIFPTKLTSEQKSDLRRALGGFD